MPLPNLLGKKRCKSYGAHGGGSEKDVRSTSDARCVNIRCMRTTLDIADDVLRAAKERAQRERKTVGEMISALPDVNVLIALLDSDQTLPVGKGQHCMMRCQDGFGARQSGR